MLSKTSNYLYFKAIRILIYVKIELKCFQNGEIEWNISAIAEMLVLWY